MYLINRKKSLGQNFLLDQNIIRKIVSIGNINKKSIVLEVGPGTGNLTREIVKQEPKKIYAVEKDKTLSLKLNNLFHNQEIIEIINNDILEVDESSISDAKIIVFGNLPYNISTQILAKWILLNKWPPWYSSLVLMFQKEVADRILAKSKSKNYGRLAVLSNWRLKIKKHFNISRNCFFPKPKVDSTLLSFVPVNKHKYPLQNPTNLEKITRIFFSNRRKMINKNFSKIFKKNSSLPKKLDLNLNLRPGDLDYAIYYKLAQHYENLF